MPLWRIYTPPTLLTPSQKSSLARAITANYVAAGLPAFYVVVLFIPVFTSDIFCSGVSLDDPSSRTPTSFMRFTVEHLARKLPDLKTRKAVMSKISDILAGQLKSFENEIGVKIRWEIHIEETPRELWRIDGLIPPEPHTEEEKMWVREDRPIRYY